MDDNFQIFKTLRESTLFEQVEDSVLLALTEQMSIERIQGGDCLIKEGDIADCMYLLVYGRLLVYQGDINHALGEIGVGDVVGELGIFIDTPRTANVCAIRDSALIRISRALFESIAERYPQAAMRILSSCVKRLLPNFKAKQHALKTLSIVPCNASAPLEDFVENLRIALSDYAKIRILGKNDEIAQREFIEHDIESNCDLVIFIAELDISEWTKRCIRQSDRIMLICDAKQPPQTGAIHYIKDNHGVTAKTDLVLIYPEDTTLPQGVSTFLEQINPNRHFNIARTADYERLARFLLGRSISVVFAGGGLRGVAHHGLVRALEERNIPIDITAGVSFGSLLSFMIAHQYNQQKLYEIWEKLAPEIEHVVDITLPITSLARGKRLYDLLVTAFGEDQYIEDLWIPSFCISTNLTDYDAYIHDRGLTWQAVRASLSLPAIFPPVVMNDKLLVDGASVNNLPVDIMRNYNNHGLIIASTISEALTNRHYDSGEEGVSGWHALYDRITHKEPHYPGIADISMDASLAASIRHQRAMVAQADIAIDLGVSEFGLMDVKSWRAIMAKGYEHACLSLDRLGVTRKSLGLKDH